VTRNAHAVKDADAYLLQIWTLLPILDQLIAIKGLYFGQNAIATAWLVGRDEFEIFECRWIAFVAYEQELWLWLRHIVLARCISPGPWVLAMTTA
jgi:hypothetical protein